MRAALAALLLCFAAPASAKVLVVFDNTLCAGEQVENDQADLRAMTGLALMFKDYGVDAKIASRKEAKTEFCRTGGMVWNYGTAAARLEQFDAVIHVGFNGSEDSSPSGVAPGYRPDSLTLTAAAPTVPQLMLTSVGGPGGQSGTGGYMYDASTCTTGVQANAGIAATSRIVRKIGTVNGFISAAHIGRLRASPTPPAGGIRKLLVAEIEADNGALPGGGPNKALTNGVAAWYDSTSNSDTAAFLVMWERPMLHKSGSSTIVFAQAFGASICSDSTGAFQPCEWSPDIVLCALARLDSLTGGMVFTSKVARTMGIAVYGGFSRSDSRHIGADPPRGIDPAYIEHLRTTRDSLRALNVPFTLQVNLDSVATYIADKAMWDSVGPAISYAIGNYGGLDSAAASGNASWTRPRDAWGRFRNRVMYGPVNGASPSLADTSLYALLKASLYRMDSLFSGRVSRVALPPFDDWSPKNMRSVSNGVDSVLLVARLAGLTGIVVDVQRRTANPNAIAKASIDLTRGWINTQGTYNGVRLLGHTGHATIAGRTQLDMRWDSTLAIGYTAGGGGPSTQHIPMYEWHRFIGGFFHDRYRDWDYMTTDGQSIAQGERVKPLEDCFADLRRASVMKMHVSDLMGDDTIPARNGYWQIKTMKNWTQTVNEFANRTIVAIVPLDRVIP